MKPHPAKRTKRQQDAALDRDGFDFYVAQKAFNRGERYYVQQFLIALHGVDRLQHELQQSLDNHINQAQH